MREQDASLDDIRQFVAQRLSVMPGRLSPMTRSGHDLGVDGDDGVEFMQAFAESFAVDLTGFEFDRYFGPEAGCNPVMGIFLRLFHLKQLRSAPITLESLLEAARSGRWSADD